MSGPRLIRNGPIRIVRFEDEAVEMEFRGLYLSHHDVSGLVTTWSLVNGERSPSPIFKANLSLMGPTVRKGYAQGMAPSLKGVDCAQLVNEATFMVDADFKQGKASTVIADAPDITPENEYAIRPLVPYEDTCIFYGDADALKTYSAFALALSSHMYLPLIAGLEPQQRLEWAVLDAESNERRFKQRMRRLLPPGADLPRMRHIDAIGIPLEAQVERLGNECADHGIEAMIFDSAVPLMAGSPNDAEAASGLFRSIKALGLKASIVIAHITKAGDQNAPYGTGFMRNTPRSLQYFQAPPRNQRVDGEPFQVGIFSKKGNDTGTTAPVFLTFCFTADGRTEIKRAEVSDPSEFKGSLATWQILKRVVQTGAQSYQQAAEATGFSVDAIGKEVRRHSTIFGREDRVVPGGKRTYFWLLDTQHQPDAEPVPQALVDPFDFGDLMQGSER
ncbi:MAG: AAA family ATPase [Candidatus Limnocylindrales bacterium]